MRTFLKKLLTSAPSLVLAVNVLAIAPAYAQHGADDTTSDSHSSTSTETEMHTVSSSGKQTTVEDNTAHSQELKDQAQTKIDELRKEKKTQLTDAERQKRCEGRKVGIENRFDNIVNKSQNIQDRITAIYTKGQDFVTANNLQPTDYAALTAAADAAKAKSVDSIAALKAATPTIDCTNKDVAAGIQSFKTAAEQTKTDLKAYRDAVKAVFKAIHAAAEAAKPADTTTTGGNQ
ncbi:MAG: hypothetical protein JWO41_513 [Candidatus Saccharibacteria bacterium]|nr:hypothetical protein [Candidatus Saccharibacteria bacterium]